MSDLRADMAAEFDTAAQQHDAGPPSPGPALEVPPGEPADEVRTQVRDMFGGLSPNDTNRNTASLIEGALDRFRRGYGINPKGHRWNR